MQFNEYQEKVLFLFKEVKRVPAIFYYALALNEEAGEFAGKIKKLYRDGNGELTPERREAALLELGDVLAYITASARELNSTVDEIAEMNLKKLYDRADRGVLKGSGDQR